MATVLTVGQYGRILHDDEVPDAEYAGYLEAQLLGIKLLASFQNKEWMQEQTNRIEIYEEEEQSLERLE